MSVDLTKLDPLLVGKMNQVLDAMRILGHPMKPVQGWRSAEYQNGLYRQGRDLPGKIVTDADGYKVLSNHQSGRAVDCAFDSLVPFAETHPWSLYGACAEAVGLVWGGGNKAGWHGQDRPHIQLPK